MIAKHYGRFLAQDKADSTSLGDGYQRLEQILAA